MFDEDDDIMGGEFESYKRAQLEESKQVFIQGCYEAYDLLVSQGPEVLKQAGPSEIQKAINRMTQLFLLNEDYERCSYLKKYVKDYMPEFEITPDPSVIKELNM